MSIQVRSNDPVQSNPPPPQTVAIGADETSPSKANESAQDEPLSSLQKKPEASDTTEREGSEVVESKTEESGDANTDDTVEAKPDESARPHKKGGFQKRIDKLNARLSDKDREIEYLRQVALKTPSNSNQEIKTESKKAEGKPDASKFDTHAEFVEALTDWKTEQKLMERDQKQEQSRLQVERDKLSKAYSERVKAFAAKNKDFDDVVSDVDDITLSHTIRDAIFTSDNGPALAYELAKNRDELERINKLNPLAAARELGRFESRISSTPSEEKVQTKKITSAPKPLDPVGTGGKGSALKSIYQAETLSQAEYEAIRREQIKRRRAQ